MTQLAIEQLEYTGERMVPEAADADTFWEHVYRYRFAAGYVRGRRVLDIACGEGYGSAAMLEAGAASVVGVDISEKAVEHARRKYGVDARVGDAARIPLGDASVDLIASFETIEHVPNPDAFLDECRRVLAPGGSVIISTPNKNVYGADHENPFHCSEMTAAEFAEKLSSRFADIEFFAQRPAYMPWWSPRWPAADTSPIYRVRGAHRLKCLLSRALCPHVRDLPPRRDVPTSLILSTDRPGAWIVNQHVVRPLSRRIDQRPRYLVAVATRK
jgi:SAM-dependent methyltransferase